MQLRFLQLLGFVALTGADRRQSLEVKQVDFVDMFPVCAQYPFTGKEEKILLIVKHKHESDGLFLNVLKSNFERLPMMKFAVESEDLMYLQKSLTFINHRPGTVVHDIRETADDPPEEYIHATYPGQQIDFREYQYMQPEMNEYLQNLYADEKYVYLTWTQSVPIPGSVLPKDPFTAWDMELYYGNMNHQMKLYWTRQVVDGSGQVQTLTTEMNRVFYLYDAPVIQDFFPISGPSQGGTRVTVQGRLPYMPPRSNPPPWQLVGTHQIAHMPHMPVQTMNLTSPLIMTTHTALVETSDQTGYVTSVPSTLHMYAECSTSASAASFDTMPNMLNDTDATTNVSLYISFNRQSWYEITWYDQFIVYDHSRLSYGNIISISPMRERLKRLHDPGKEHRPADVLRVARGNSNAGRHARTIGVGTDVQQATDKFFVILPQAGAEATAGMPVECGSTIRLMHHETMQNLHTWFGDSHTSHQQEVSLSGFMGRGDYGDNWVLLCENNTNHSYAPDWHLFQWEKPFHARRYSVFMQELHRYWKKDTAFRLWNPHSNSYLSYTSASMTKRTCSMCNGMVEVTTAHLRSAHDAAVLNLRWYVKQVLHVPFACTSPLQGSQSGSTAWLTYQRPIRVGDFVAWRNQSVVPCENMGTTHIGMVNQLYPQSQTLSVDEWAPISPQHSLIRHFVSYLRHEQIMHGKRPLAISNVYGPLRHQWERPGSHPFNHSSIESQEDLVQIPAKQQRAYVKLFVSRFGQSTAQV